MILYHYTVIKEVLTLQNVIILIKSVLNRDENHCYYNIVLEKSSYQLSKKCLITY